MNARASNNFCITKAALNKAAELYLSSQVNKSKSLEIDIDSEANKLIKGEINSINFNGKEIVVFQDISIKEINLKSDSINLDLLEAISGTIKLEKPSNIQGQIILSQADCNHLINSKYLATLLERLPIKIDERLFTFDIRHAKCDLKDNNKLTLSAELILSNCFQFASLESQKCTNSGIEKISKFEIDLLLVEDGRKIIFEGGKYQENQTLSLEATVAVLGKIRDLVYFRHFTSPSLNFQIKTIEVKAEQIILDLDATVNQLPDSLESSLITAALEIN
ncbi:LmeA family phospholipid-binding protein [Myxosarcina sp. GI1]|uniref:LmeA family phospholipid-binding protein n=1 Tax=Myxosarcina sp. GI1 TaxID=1541065 RepID=UPI000562210C|nr:LmeA family phospholipid-binding protein [Myxosarcina sp. GI1]